VAKIFTATIKALYAVCDECIQMNSICQHVLVVFVANLAHDEKECFKKYWSKNLIVYMKWESMYLCYSRLSNKHNICIDNIKENLWSRGFLEVHIQLPKLSWVPIQVVVLLNCTFSSLNLFQLLILVLILSKYTLNFLDLYYCTIPVHPHPTHYVACAHHTRVATAHCIAFVHP